MNNISVQQYIKDTLIEQLGQVIHISPYPSFLLICSGIEFLGKCINPQCRWIDNGKRGKFFKNAISDLFPKHYKNLRIRLYKELRCGMAHSQLPGSFKLTQIKNDPGGQLSYQKHLLSNKDILMLDYFYFDFVQACLKVISKNFPEEDKMNKPFISVGPV
jgi:hypothetical protein